MKYYDVLCDIYEVEADDFNSSPVNAVDPIVLEHFQRSEDCSNQYHYHTVS